MTKNTLASRVDNRNNLNAVRLFLSLLVVFAHSFPVSLGVERTGRFNIACGEMAVNLFFFISGLLITQSWLRSKTMNEYLRRRILRIYPGFIAALMFSLVAAAAANPAGVMRHVIPNGGWKRVVLDCLSLSSYSISGSEIFVNNPLPNYANSSLWTIPFEFQCYLLVCLVGLFCLFKFRSLVLALFMGSYLLFARSVILHPDTPSVHMRFLAYFSAGMCAWLWRDKLPFRWSIAIGLAALLAASVFANISVLFMSPFALTYLAMRIGYAKPFALTKWCDTTDLSYGVYLYAFPIQQLLALSPALHNPWRMVAAAVPLSLLAAFASWHLVEKRFLRLKKYRFVDEDPGAATPVSPSIVKDLEQAF